MSISRRSFLKGAAAASLAVAASTVLAGCNTNIVTTGAYLSGTKTGSITVSEGKTIDLTAVSAQAIEYNNSLAVKVTVKNNMTGSDLGIAKNESTGYVLVPSIVVNGEDELSGPAFTSATVSTIEKSTSEDTTLLFKPELKNWTTAEITLTLYNGSAEVGTPVVFTVKKA